MNYENAIKQLTEGKPYVDKGQQRCGFMHGNNVVFELKFPFISAIENLSEEQLRDIATTTKEGILAKIRTI